VEELRRRGKWDIWKAVRVRDPEDVTRAVEALGDCVDGLLLDGWHPDRPGGSGASFSWEDVSVVRDRIPSHLKVIVAGGLTPENVAAAVHTLRPDVVDVSSGVELEIRRKDRELVRAFIRNARGEE
jgi:phosphoribosylanthranilate isomerase